MKKFLKIGLTGGIGSGKSLVLKLIAAQGIPVLQADQVGHEVLRKGDIKKKLSRLFGGEILNSRGEVDRKELAKVVFRDRGKQKILNELVHPPIRKRVSQWFQKRKKERAPMGVVEVPLLFERGYNRKFDRTLSVSSPKKTRWRRLLKRGWNIEEIKRRESSQWPQSRKDKNADWVIFNQGSRKDLKYAVCRWMNSNPWGG